MLTFSPSHSQPLTTKRPGGINKTFGLYQDINTEFLHGQQTPNHVEQIVLTASLCDKRVEVMEEKLKGVSAQMSQNKEFYEYQIKTIRESGELHNKICDQRVQLASQQCIINITESAKKKNGPVDDGITAKLLLSFPRSKYYVSTQRLSWHLAGKFCKLNGMELASIETEAENNALFAITRNDTGSFWISGTDSGSEGKFYWAGTGKDVEDFTNFVDGEPNNDKGNENCLELFTHESVLYWNDNFCEDQNQFICEFTS
ncbi:Hypothetical predicted protein [Cloeon dipterum]|uniref:C-type lectin domain-containing protein n=1 Tax=Cloeon dipterum TaxID=197152 RepID=A0A8S1C962_9INSE|nr:Hypothetical predicted protein [Cloeon dipterum]